MSSDADSSRLYQDLARKLHAEIAEGRYVVGGRLPSERELAQKYNLSRPTVREAIIALEVQGFVEVRVGSGAYVVKPADGQGTPGFSVSAIELTEARLMFEGEAAALAATQVSAEDLAEIASLVEQIAAENQAPDGAVSADKAFHLAIARATRNRAIYEAIERLWELRARSPEAALLHEKARTANIKPVVDEHTAILEALKARDPAAARAAMRAHLSQVLESLLFATEERQIEAAREAARAQRERYSRATA